VAGSRTVPRRSTRAVLVLGILAGLNTAGMLAYSQPEQISLASDVYYHAATALLEGGDVYEVDPPGLSGYHYIYPPIVLVVFLPHALLGSTLAAYVLQTILNLAAGLALGWVLVRSLRRRGVGLARIDRLLLVAFALASAWSASQIVMGQTTLWLALAIALAIEWVDRDLAEGRPTGSRAGILAALAALVKLFPAVLGLWFLRLRRDRTVLAAIATGLGGLALGALLLGPDLTETYLTEVLVDRFEGQTFEGTPDPERNHTTARRMLAAAFGGSSPIVTILAFALVVPPVAYCYRDVTTSERRLAAALATIVGTFLVMPLQPLYNSLFTLPAIVLLFGLDAGRPRRLLIAGCLFTFALVGPETIEQNLGPLPAGISEPIVEAARALFTVVLPPTIGMWLLLAACVAMQAGAPGSWRDALVPALTAGR